MPKSILLTSFFVAAIFFHSNTASAYTKLLKWSPNPDNNGSEVGYQVYYSDSTGSFNPMFEAQQGPTPIDVGNVTQFQVDLPDGIEKYHFAVTCYDDRGLESAFSKILECDTATLVCIQLGVEKILAPKGFVLK